MEISIGKFCVSLRAMGENKNYYINKVLTERSG